MLNDSLIFGHDRLEPGDDRRRSARAAVRAELVVLWHHDPRTAVRYPVLDMSDGGVRILSSTPLLKGMSGTAVKLLPKGEAVNRPCRVSWTRPPALDGPFEIGLHFA